MNDRNDKNPGTADYMQVIKTWVGNEDVVFTSIGKITHYWHEVFSRDLNFYLRHGMGYASSMALGFSLALPQRRVIVMDGDGAALMNLGSFATIAGGKPANFKHIIFQNNCYESTGSQQLPGEINFIKIAEGCGLRNLNKADGLTECKEILENGFLEIAGYGLLVLNVTPKTGEEFPLVSPPFDALEMKYRFVRGLT